MGMWALVLHANPPVLSKHHPTGNTNITPGGGAVLQQRRISVRAVWSYMVLGWVQSSLGLVMEAVLQQRWDSVRLVHVWSQSGSRVVLEWVSCCANQSCLYCGPKLEQRDSRDGKVSGQCG